MAALPLVAAATSSMKFSFRHTALTPLTAYTANLTNPLKSLSRGLSFLNSGMFTASTAWPFL
eukprot:scaffold394938_cov46-Prasinocladus_malaysianus.AAC.1